MSDDEETIIEDQPLQFLSLFHKRQIKTISIDEEKLEKLYSDLCCTICRQLFNSPVYLKCSHRFCKECIEKYIRSNGKKSCPNCRGDLSTKRDLRNDYAISSLIRYAFVDRKQFCEEIQDIEKQEFSNIVHAQRKDENSINQLIRYRSSGEASTQHGLRQGRRRVKPNESSIQARNQSQQQDPFQISYTHQDQDVSLPTKIVKKRGRRKNAAILLQQNRALQLKQEQARSAIQEDQNSDLLSNNLGLTEKDISRNEDSESNLQAKFINSALGKPRRRRSQKKKSSIIQLERDQPFSERPSLMDIDRQSLQSPYAKGGNYDVSQGNQMSASSQLAMGRADNRNMSRNLLEDSNQVERKGLDEEDLKVVSQSVQLLKQELGDNSLLKLIQMPHLNFSVELGLTRYPNSLITPIIDCKSVQLSLKLPVSTLFVLIARFLRVSISHVKIHLQSMKNPEQYTQLCFKESKDQKLFEINKAFWKKQDIEDINIFDLREMLEKLELSQIDRKSPSSSENNSQQYKIFSGITQEDVVKQDLRKRNKKKGDQKSKQKDKLICPLRTIYYELASVE